jgi:hypothetical protein
MLHICYTYEYVHIYATHMYIYMLHICTYSHATPDMHTLLLYIPSYYIIPHICEGATSVWGLKLLVYWALSYFYIYHHTILSHVYVKELLVYGALSY